MRATDFLDADTDTSAKPSADQFLDSDTSAPAPSAYQFAPPPAAQPPSITRTAVGTVERNIAPLGAAIVATKAAGPVTGAIGRLAGARIGATVGAGIGALVPGADVTGASEGIGAVIGGLIGLFAPGFVAQTAAQKAQQKIADVVAPKSELGTEETAAEETAHPNVSTAVGLLTIGRPNPLKLVRAGQTIASGEGRAALSSLLAASKDADSLAAWREATAPAIQKGVGDVIDTAHAGAINAAFNVAGQIQSGQYSASELAKAAAEGTLFNSPWISARHPATDQFDAAKQQKTEVPNASEITSPTQVPVRNEGGEMGQGARVRQQGEVAPARQEEGQETPPVPETRPREEVGSTFADIGRVAAMTPEQFTAHVGPEQPGELSSLTRKAYELGMNIRTPQELRALQGAQSQAKDFRGQFFREAYEAATGTGSAGLALSKDPNYKPPLPMPASEPAKAPETVTPPAAPVPSPAPAGPAASVKPDFIANYDDPFGSKPWRVKNGVGEDWKLTEVPSGGWVAESPVTEKKGQWGKLVRTVDGKGNGRVLPVRSEPPTGQPKPVQPEIVQEPISAAVRAKSGELFTGNSHDEIYAKNPKAKGTEGFILPSGEFIPRKEAAKRYAGRQHSHEFDFGKPLGELYESARENLKASPRDFEREYAKQADKEVAESKSEFLKRMFCSGKFPSRKGMLSE